MADQPAAELVGLGDEDVDIAADAQMDVVDTLVDEAQPIVARVRHPHADEALGHPAPPADQQMLAEPVLRAAGRDRRQHDHAEEHQLVLDGGHVARFERVEEAAVPLVDQHRHIDEQEFEHDDTGQQCSSGPAVLATEIRQKQRQEDAEIGCKALHDTSPAGKPTPSLQGLPGHRAHDKRPQCHTVTRVLQKRAGQAGRAARVPVPPVPPVAGEPVISMLRWCKPGSAAARPIEITIAPGSFSDSIR